MSEQGALIDTERAPLAGEQNPAPDPSEAPPDVELRTASEEPTATAAELVSDAVTNTVETVETVETTAEPSAAEPPGADPDAAQPAVAEAAVSEAAVSEAAVSEAVVVEPAAAEPAPPAQPAKPRPPKRLSKRHLATVAVLEKAMNEKTVVSGKVIGWNKGGYHVVFDGVAAFCPVSQIEIGSPRSPKRYVDQTLPFLVLEIQKGGRRIVVSRSEALKLERETKAAEARERFKPGMEVNGTISSLTDFGAFVELGGGIEGLVHVSELSRKRIENPRELLQIGQPVKVVVLKVQNQGERISLSMKKLEPDPWHSLGERCAAGSQFTGVVLRRADFGLFVEVEPGVEGLIHTSRLLPGMELSDERLEPGKTVEGWVHECDPKRHRLALSLREIRNRDPWADAASRFAVGTVVRGKVERLASFGAFVEIEPGLTGLLPFSMVAQTPNANLRRQYHLGKEVTVQVLGIDVSKRRISLGTEASTAEGSQSDYRDYVNKQTRGERGSGLGALAAAFAKLRTDESAGG